MQLDNEIELTKEKQKIPMSCRNCDHSCHCGNNGVCAVCKCANCEHNALDEFYNRLEENAGALLNLTKHRD